MINLNDAARAIYEANSAAGIESVFMGKWDELPKHFQYAYLHLAGEVLTALHLDYVANEAPNADNS